MNTSREEALFALALEKPVEKCAAFQSASRRRAEAALWRAAQVEGLAQPKTWRNDVASALFLATALIAQPQTHAIDGGGGREKPGRTPSRSRLSEVLFVLRLQIFHRLN